MIVGQSYSRYLTTDNKLSIFSYACREHSTVAVPAGQVAIKGFLKMWGSDKGRLLTLWRSWQCDSIINKMNRIPFEVGQTKCYSLAVPTNWYKTSSSRPLCPPLEFCNSPVLWAPSCRWIWRISSLRVLRATPLSIMAAVQVVWQPSSWNSLEVAIDATGLDCAAWIRAGWAWLQ